MADIVGTEENDTLSGTSGADTIYGLGGNDIINGNGGDDVIVGGAGADTLSGGGGNDIFEMDLDNDYAAGDSINGGSGADTLLITNQSYAFQLSALSYTSIERLLANGVFFGLGVTAAQLNGFNFIGGWFNLSGTGSITLSSGTTISNSRFDLAAGITAFSFTAATGVAVEVYAGDGGVTITGSASNDVLIGGAGNDTLNGGAGNDNFVGGFGSDILSGGDGDDYFSFTQYADGPAPEVAAGDTVHGGTGIDTLSFYLSDQEATLGLLSYSSIERIQSGGFSALRVTAAELAGFTEVSGVFRIIGAGPVVLGSITLGGLFLLDDGIGSFNFSAATYSEVSVDGSSANETIVAGNGRNSIRGMDGNDTITGGSGYDYIQGGAGNDVLYGGTGEQHDHLFGGAGLDRLYGGDGDDTLDAGLSTDMVAGEVYDGGAGFDLLSLFDVFGEDTGTFDLTGVTISGIEHLYSGMTTNTRLMTAQLISAQIISGRFVLADNAAVSLTGITHLGLSITLNDAGQTISLAGSNGFYANFGSGAYIYGGAGNDVITGGGNFVAYLYGGDGDDILTEGGTYLNYLDGGNGNDRLIATGGSTAHGGEGYDTLVIAGAPGFSGAYALSGLEALELTPATNLTLTGTQFFSGFAANTAVSGSGTITVNMDPDVYFFSTLMTFTGSVSLVINGTSGVDIIKMGHSVNTINAGDGTDQIRGGNLVDTINGGGGGDKIMGRGGADVITGGLGDDRFRYIDNADSGFGAARDRITDFTSGQDLIDFSWFDGDAVTAGDQAFTFVGTAAFTNTGIGQLRYTTSGGDILLQADTNGDGVADMEIILQGIGASTLTAADFIL